jgi:hypothetical protein
MEYNETINNFLEVNYTFLLECATNILKGNKTEPGDLIAELCLYLYDNENKLSHYVGRQPLLAFSLSWMSLQARFKTTPFNRRYKRNVEYTDTDIKRMTNTPFEESNDDERLQDLQRIYTDDQCDKIMKVWEIIPELSKTNQIIYKAYFEDGLSYDKIKDNYTFFKKNGKKIIYYKSKASISKMVNNLKNEIKKKL